MYLSYKDIIARQNALRIDDCVVHPPVNIQYLYESFFKKKYSYKNARMILENWTELSDDENVQLDKIFEVFFTILDDGNQSNSDNAANIIENRIVPKLRNAKQTRQLNNYKRGWIKHRHTSMLNDTKDNMTAVNRAKANGGYLGNSLHPNRKYERDIFGNKIDKEVKKPNEGGEGENDKEQQSTEEAYFDRFIKAASINEQCDRVLTNHKKLNARFNFEEKVRRCSLDESSLQKCIYEICELIDSYDIPFGVKYNIALENIMFLMQKNCVPIDNSSILESVTDYFLMTEITDERLHDMKYILENSKFFSADDMQNVGYIMLTEQEEAELVRCVDQQDFTSTILEDKSHEMFLQFKEKYIKTIKQKAEADSLKIKKIIHDFKRSHKKSIETFKDAISKIFVQSPEAIINELPDVFSFVRLGIVIGAFAINPILGVLTTITGFFLKMKISREQMAKVIARYTKERDKYKKLAKEATDEKKKEKYTTLYKKYEEDIDKLETRENDLYTDAENDKRMEEKWAKEAENDDSFNMDDFDFDFNFDEAVKYTQMLATLYEQINFTKAGLMNTIRNNIGHINTDDVYNITEAVKLCNDIFDCPKFVNILEEELENTRASGNYLKSAALKQCISEIQKIKYNSLLESTYEIDESVVPPIEAMYEQLKCKYDLMNDTLDLLTQSKNVSINEGKDGLSFTSKLKIASENLRRFALKAKDKDKQLSMKMDSELNRVAKAAKNAMISDNREQIIKGTFLPSASKCIHIALASGATFLFSPVAAVIGLIGFIGTSRKINKKERTLIIDDIDIEIKMCDKYMKIAEDKEDLTAVREIMKTKRDLERQRARILYDDKYLFKGKKAYDMKPKSMSKNDED